MAIYERTNRGIEYNTDGYDEADVLKDMKHLAETTDNAIENAVQEATYDDTSVKSRLTTAEGKISNIEAEQNTQNTNISANASAINALQGTVQAQGQTLEQHTTEIDTTNQNITNLTGRVSTNEEDIAAFDKSFHNRGWMKGSDAYCTSDANNATRGSAFRDLNNTLRKVITTFETDGQTDVYFRVQQKMQSVNNEMNFDFIELCPSSVYNNEFYPEDRW